MHFGYADGAENKSVDSSQKPPLEYTSYRSICRLPLAAFLPMQSRCDFRLHQDLATLLYSIDGKTWIPAIKDFKMQYDYRRLFMGTRIAIYNYATKAAGGYIDVDSFEYSKRK